MIWYKNLIANIHLFVLLVIFMITLPVSYWNVIAVCLIVYIAIRLVRAIRRYRAFTSR